MKTLKNIFSSLAALALVAGCQVKEPMAKLPAPEDIKAPVLANIEGEIVITAKNQATDKVTFKWSPVELGVNSQINYSIQASVSEGGKAATLASGVTATEKEIDFESLNQILFNGLEIEAGVATPIYYRVAAQIGEYEPIWSNYITVNCTASAAEKVYPMIYVIGNFNDWSDFPKTQQLFSFENNSVYSGMVCFFGKASKGFKIRGTATGWDDATQNWGLQNAVADENPAELQLWADGGSSDIKNYNKNFIHLTFDTSTALMKADMMFDKVGVIGLNGDWNNDISMRFNDTKQVFYADIEATSDTQFKFRMDGAWDINYGGDMAALSKGGDNINIKQGKYRVYLKMNNLNEVSCWLDPDAYGAEGEGNHPEFDPGAEAGDPLPTEMYIIGNEASGCGNWSWDSEDIVTMTQINGEDSRFWAIHYFTTDAEFKFSPKKDWGDDFTGLDTNEGFISPGNNKVEQAGLYMVYVDCVAKSVTLEPATVYGMGNCFGGWSAGVPFTQNADGTVSATVTAGGELRMYTQTSKFAADWWKMEFIFFEDGKIQYRGNGGDQARFNVTEGATVTLDFSKGNGKGSVSGGAAPSVKDPSAFVVGLSGSKFGWDDPDGDDKASFTSKTLTDEATLAGNYVYSMSNVTFANGDEFKLRIDGAWIGHGQAEISGFSVTDNGGNFLAGEGGTFNISISFDWDGSTTSNIKMAFSK